MKELKKWGKFELYSYCPTLVCIIYFVVIVVVVRFVNF